MKALWAVVGVLVVLAGPLGAQDSNEAADEAALERAVTALNSQLAAVEDAVVLKGGDYTVQLNGDAVFCAFFAEIQREFPIYKDMSCKVRN